MAKFISLVGTPRYNEQFENDNLVESIININNFKSIDIDANMNINNYNVDINIGRVNVITIAEMSTFEQAERVVVAIGEAIDNDRIKVINLKDIIESAVHPSKRDAHSKDDSASIRIDCGCCMMRCSERGPVCSINQCPNVHFCDKPIV